MRNNTKLSTRVILFLIWGLLFGLASCSRVPSKPTTSSYPPPAAVQQVDQQQEVEQQLLHTLSEARKLGPANPLLLSTMYSLASFYREHQAFEKAERVYQEALHLKERVNGPEHQDIIIILHQYAALLRDARREQEATALEHRARQIKAIHAQSAAFAP